MSAGRDPTTLLEVEDPDFETVMACVLGVRPREVRTYVELLDRPGATVEEIADALDRDRSNASRSLSTLLDLDLVERERRLLDDGGHVYQYTATPFPETKERLHDAVDAWVERVHDTIEDVGGAAGR